MGGGHAMLRDLFTSRIEQSPRRFPSNNVGHTEFGDRLRLNACEL